MAEEAKKKAEAPEKPAPAPAPADKGADKAHGAKAAGATGVFAKTPVLIGGVMIIEAAVLFAGFKFLGGHAPPSAEGADLATVDPPADDKVASGHGAAASGHAAAGHSGASSTTPAANDKSKVVEIDVVKDRFPNRQNGRTFLYDVTVVAVAKGSNKDRVETTFKERKHLITDRIRTIIATCDPEKLGGGSEPGLETLRRQVKYQLDDIVGEGVIEEVLVPQCIPFRADY